MLGALPEEFLRGGHEGQQEELVGDLVPAVGGHGEMVDQFLLDAVLSF